MRSDSTLPPTPPAAAAGTRASLGMSLGTIGGLLAALIAMLVHRLWPQPRPFMLGLGPLWLDHGARPGLPSSHATAMFSLAFSLWLQGARRSGALVLLLGALVGWSRVFLGVHFPLDILAALPAGWRVAAVHPLRVPGLDAERHLVEVVRAAG